MLRINEQEIYFAKVNETAIIPSKREEDGWYDIYANFEQSELIIPPLSVALIPTGIASAFSSRYRIAFGERGSNTKATLHVMAGKIDSGYRGEYFVALYNGNDIEVVISKNMDEVMWFPESIHVPYTKAIAQFAVEEVPQVTITETTLEELKSIKSERGNGMMGSSGK